MLDVKTIREDEHTVRKALRAKGVAGVDGVITDLLSLDEEFRLLRGDLEAKQARRNSASKEIGLLKRQGEDAEALIREMSTLSDEVKRLEERSRSLESRLNELLLEVPNLPHASVPYGESEHDNVVVHERGEKPSFAFAPKPHWELAAARDWLDLEAGVKVTGAGFPVFKAGGARLLRALVQYSLDSLGEEGYVEVAPPLMVNAESATGTGQLPDKEGQMYQVADGFYLIPTSEVPVTNLHRGDILDEARLPIKYTAYSACFRREAGSYGAHVRGVNRVHQFDKVEMVQLTHPEKSYEALEEMTETSESLLEALGLPYRRLLLSTGDMTFAGAKTYDLEVWSPGQERWLEVSSVSNFETFQARRLGTRFREGGVQGRGKTELVHTLNGSAFGMVRLLAALLETFQNEDGTIAVPEVLRPYLGQDVLD